MAERVRDNAGPHSQTLSRGLRALEVLADAERALSIDEVADELGVHRSIAYRIVRTLEDHRLIARDPAGLCLPGAGLAILAHSVSRDLQHVALPELAAVAEDLGMTAFVAVHDHDECVTLGSVEPRRAAATVAQRPGSRHPLDRGAPGIALLTLLGAADRDAAVRTEVTQAGERGYATSQDQVIRGVSSVAVPIPSRRATQAALAVVYVSTDRSVSEVVERLRTASNAVAAQVG